VERKHRSVDIGGALRHHVTILHTPSPLNDRASQFAFLSDLINNGYYTGLMNCGPLHFHEAKIRHNGTQWQIEMEATEETP
jgi:hypothetical protein